MTGRCAGEKPPQNLHLIIKLRHRSLKLHQSPQHRVEERVQHKVDIDFPTPIESVGRALKMERRVEVNRFGTFVLPSLLMLIVRNLGVKCPARSLPCLSPISDMSHKKLSKRDGRLSRNRSKTELGSYSSL